MVGEHERIQTRVLLRAWKVMGWAFLALAGCHSLVGVSHRPDPAGESPPRAAQPAAPEGEIIQTAVRLEQGDSPALETPANKPRAGRDNRKEDSSTPGFYQPDREMANPANGFTTPVIQGNSGVCPLGLSRALSLAGVENPQIALAEQAIQASLALQLRAQVLLLPSLTAGGNYHWHTGPLQNSFGAIRQVTSNSLYFGAGARTLAAESVAFPGVRIFAHLGEALFEPQIASRVVATRQFEALATRNNALLDVAIRYLALLRAEGELAVVRQSQADFAEVVRLTANFAKTGAGSESDATRAQTDALLLEEDEKRAQEEVAVAAADLARFLNLDPSVRLQTSDIPIQVVQFVDPSRPLPELLQVALGNRPEMSAAAADISANQARLRNEQVRPLFPVLSVGYSYGDFGGGSNISPPFLGRFAQRSDFDVLAVWTLQNLGMGNLALVRQQRARVNQAEAERIRVLNQIREEVADGFNRSAARYSEIDVSRREVQSAADAYQHDLARVRNGQGRPLELLSSTKGLLDARRRLLAAIMGYDEAQFQLFVALGQPPTLAVTPACAGK